MTKMTKQEMKTKWLEELRSGNHLQVKGTLCGKNSSGEVGFCCLGVFHKHVLGKSVRVEEYGTVYEGAPSHYENMRNFIPQYVFSEGIALNDDGYSFKEISYMIEKEWVID